VHINTKKKEEAQKDRREKGKILDARGLMPGQIALAGSGGLRLKKLPRYRIARTDHAKRKGNSGGRTKRKRGPRSTSDVQLKTRMLSVGVADALRKVGPPPKDRSKTAVNRGKKLGEGVKTVPPTTRGPKGEWPDLTTILNCQKDRLEKEPSEKNDVADANSKEFSAWGKRRNTASYQGNYKSHKTKKI